MSTMDRCTPCVDEKIIAQANAKTELPDEYKAHYAARELEFRTCIDRYLQALRATGVVFSFQNLRDSYDLTYEKPLLQVSGKNKPARPAVICVWVQLDREMEIMNLHRGRSRIVQANPLTFEPVINLAPLYERLVSGISSLDPRAAQDHRTVDYWKNQIDRAFAVCATGAYAKLSWNHHVEPDAGYGDAQGARSGETSVQDVILARVSQQESRWICCIYSGRVKNRDDMDTEPRSQLQSWDWSKDTIQHIVSKAYREFVSK